MPTATPPGPPARITTGNAAPITNKAVAQQVVARFGPHQPALPGLPDAPAGRRTGRASRTRRKGVVP
jgi:hypothetical protein